MIRLRHRPLPFAPVRRRTDDRHFGESTFRSVWNGRTTPADAD